MVANHCFQEKINKGRYLSDPPSGMQVKTCAINKFSRKNDKWQLEKTVTEHRTYNEDDEDRRQQKLKYSN